MQHVLTRGALCAVLAMALGSPAFCAEAISFSPGSPWSQTIGTVSKTDNFHEYTVTADAGKTMQINLISRNPNLYFRVLPADSRKPLVDTMKSGATTWTTKPEANETYTVRVYQDPSTVASGDVTKYALQIGIY
ncbi:MAG: hypothetical protein ACTHMO_11250 [Rhodanobacteraceae bacterium]